MAYFSYYRQSILRYTYDNLCEFHCFCVWKFQVQQLKSVNNLWSDWQLGVSEFILIPVSSSNSHCSATSAAGLNNGGPHPPSASSSCELVTRQELTQRSRLPKCASDGHLANDSTSKTAMSGDCCKTSTASMQDYFSKYDLSLEKIKQNVHRMEQSMK